jgi:uncharacterized membrane protein HdeD (DUF308 family)
MAPTPRSLTLMQHALRDALGSHWRVLMIEGVTTIILGWLAITAPTMATVAVDLFVGWLLVLCGVIGLAAIFWTHDVPAFFWSPITAALSVAAGILLIARPLQGALSLTLVLTAFFIAEGAFQVATSITYRNVIGVMEMDARERPHRSGDGRNHYGLLAGQRHLAARPAGRY